MSRFKLFLILINYIKKHYLSYLFGLIALIIIDVIELFIPAQTGYIIDIVKTESSVISDIYPFLIKIIIFISIITLLRFVWRFTLLGTARKVETEIRQKLYDKFIGLSQEFYTENKTGDLMSYFTNDLNAIRMIAGPGFLMISDFILITFLVIIRMLYTTDLVLTIVACLPLPIISLVSVIATKKMHTLYETKQKAFGSLSDVTQESISGVRIIKSFVQYIGAEKRFKKFNVNNRDITIKTIKVDAIVVAIIKFAVGLSFLITLIYGGYLTKQKVITLGEFVAFYEYLLLLIWPSFALGWGINIISKGLSSVKRIDSLLNVKPAIFDNENAVTNIKDNDISIKNLSFNYPNSNSSNFSLTDININFDKNRITAITGRTGSGKTTLVNLLTRTFNPMPGTVFIGGVDVLDIKLETLRSLISVVTQDVFLFSETISENIKIGIKEFGIDDIIASSKIASFHENVTEFPEQYETIVGERGVTLSGGQKQRLTIARAIIRNSPILILDDSLSAVDIDTEKQIIQNILEQRKNMTTIVISHRISTILNSDKIVVIENGKLMETGTHDSLLKANGLYKELFEKQKLEEAINE